MKIKFIMLCLIMTYNILSAAESKDLDSLKEYKLGEVEITDKAVEMSKINKAAVVDIPYYVIQNSDVLSAAELQLYLPSGSIRTNSRGESMLFLRGAGERQLGLFFDGAAMNVPWDNRIDLTFVPTDIIGNIRINKSSNSMLYGPNVLGGAVSITTVERVNPGYGLTVKLQAGEGNSRNYSILHDGRIGDFNYIANFSYMKSDGFTLSESAPDSLSNQNNNSALRTNTDQKRLNAYLRGEYKFGDNSTIGLSFSYTSQEKGVAPETYAGEDARFWRYPERDRIMLTLNGLHDFSESLSLKATFWYDKFSQQIDSYSSFEYKEISEVQKDDDNVAGTRISLNYNLRKEHRLSLVLNGFTTKHEQSIDDVSQPEFSQNTISTGLEYTGLFSNLEVNAGAGFDYNETPKTGIFVEAEGVSQSDFAGFLALKYLLSDEFAVIASTSRRTRFPSMREQYDGALGSFKTNPDLKAETGLLNEFGVVYSADKFSAKIVGFYNLYDDLIERIRLSKEQDSLRRRMRVNYSNATISGVDFDFSYEPLQKLNVEGFVTYMNIEAKQDGKKIAHLVQKPEILAGLMTNYTFDFGLKPQIEIEYDGKQYEIDPNNTDAFLTIDPAFILNFRIGYALLINNVYTELFVRVNNITDEYKLSQYGLPAPGRMFYSGLMVRL